MGKEKNKHLDNIEMTCYYEQYQVRIGTSRPRKEGWYFLYQNLFSLYAAVGW